MDIAERIINKFGGVRPMARALNIPPSTIQSWKTSGLIPAQNQQLVLSAAQANEIRLTPADFFSEAAQAAE